MAYFNHAFRKTFVATNGISSLTGVQLGTSTTNMLSAGEVTFINPNSFQVNPDPSNFDPECCEFIFASGSLMRNDKIGPFAGGYLESNKSKTVKAKYVNRLYYSPANPAQPYITHVGYTPWTSVNPPSSSVPGETAGNCCKEFLCGETYYLRVDIKGSPAMRMLNHNAYLTLEAYTGCCPDQPDDPLIAPVPVDPTLVYITWAKQFLNSPIVNPFAFPVVTFYDDATGNWIYYYPDNVNTALLPVPPLGTSYANFSDYSPLPYSSEFCAGIVFTGAYYETRFENCTFQVSDFYEVEPVRIYASEVDYTGSPCEFQTLCVGVECPGRQVNGLGETIVRDVILSESYRQNHFATDFRIREITQGYDILNAAGVLRDGLYDRIYLQHNVPRFYNPTGTFDNDQYLLEIIVPQGDPDDVYRILAGWLTGCGSECQIQELPTGDPCEPNVVPTPFDPPVIG
jgi:hypothetical protein